MTILVLGASGATGRLLVEQLLNRGQRVKAVVREGSGVPVHLQDNPALTLVRASLLELDDQALLGVVKGCRGIASCLGHNLTFKGMYGKPRRLVTEAARRLCNVAVELHKQNGGEPIKFCLMNSSAVVNHQLNEKVSTANKILTGLIRALVPPHRDNEGALAYLQKNIGSSNPNLGWVAVRPDGLINEERVGDYSIRPSPIRDPILDAGKTSRINVAAFMAELLVNDDLWCQWQGQTPLIYNADSVK